MLYDVVGFRDRRKMDSQSANAKQYTELIFVKEILTPVTKAALSESY